VINWGFIVSAAAVPPPQTVHQFAVVHPLVHAEMPLSRAFHSHYCWHFVAVVPMEWPMGAIDGRRVRHGPGAGKKRGQQQLGELVPLLLLADADFGGTMMHPIVAKNKDFTFSIGHFT
jgi:hypothetical protein